MEADDNLARALVEGLGVLILGELTARLIIYSLDVEVKGWII